VTASEKPRVAIGVFHDIDRLRAAVGSLAAEHSGERDILVLSEVGALDGRIDDLNLAPAGRATGFTPAVANVQWITRTVTGADGGAISAGFDGRRSQLTSGQLLHFETWLASRFAIDLDNHLKAGACLLICPACDAGQEKVVTGILLRHAAGGVQLHDIGSPAG
jgi:hypothetical protein